MPGVTVLQNIQLTDILKNIEKVKLVSCTLTICCVPYLILSLYVFNTWCFVLNTK